MTLPPPSPSAAPSAVDDAAAAVRRDPAAAAGWTALALALLGAGRNDEALEAARNAVDRALTASPTTAETAGAETAGAQRALALTLLRQRRIDDAEAAVQAALRAAPGYPEGQATLALIRMMQGRTQEADALFRHALAVKGDMAEAVGNHAALLARLGRDREALETADRALALKPSLSAAHGLRGGLLHRAGRFDEAAAAFAEALDANPAVAADLHANHAEALRQAGRPQAAADAARAGLALHPDHPALLTNLGAALHAMAQPDAALAAYEAALQAAPGLAAAENNVARLHLEAGRPEQALARLRGAFAARPDNPDIARSLAALLLERDAGAPAEAVGAAQAAVDAAPGDVAARILLGQALVRAGQGERAEAAFVAAIQAAPARHDVWLQAGTALLRGGRRGAAVQILRQLCRIAPDDARHWALLGQALRRTRFSALDGQLRADLLAAFARPGTDNAHLTEAAASVVLLHPAAARWRDAAGDPDHETAAAAVRGLLNDGTLRELAGDPLLTTLLRECVIADPALERMLVALRRALLDEAGREEAGREEGRAALDDPVWLPLLCALADQCFLNEYAFPESPAETAAANRLAARLEAALGLGAPPSPARLAALAAWRPLVRWSGAAALAGRAWPPAIADLLTRHIAEPQAEEALKAALPRLTPVDDAISAAVRAQYEENPYPRWRQAGLLSAPVPVPAAIRAMFPHVALPPGPHWDAPEILVAGCGSGREALWAHNHFGGARVAAVDVSLSSLAHGARLCRELGADIAFAQADILRLADAFAADDRRFDVIQCVGVLHHMADPLAGWTALRRLLRPHGLMKIGLYSRRARQPLAPARDFIAAGGYSPAAADIRRFRRDVLALPEHHPVRTVSAIPDFYGVSACRDLLFHVQEHNHDLLQIAGWLDALALEPLGLQLDDQTTTALYRARFPQDRTMTDLALWDRFEAEFPHVFGEMYQLWVRPRT